MKRFFSVVGAFIIATGMSCGLFIGVSYADALDGSDETENSEVDDTERGGIPELTYIGGEYYEQTGDIDFYQIIQAVDAEDGELTLSAENTACVLKAIDEEVTEDGYQAYELSCTVTDTDGNTGELTHTLYIKATSDDEGETEPTPDDNPSEDDGGETGDDGKKDDEGDNGGDEGDGDEPGGDHQGDEGGDGNGDGDEPGTNDPVQPGGPDNPSEPGDEPGSGDDTPGSDDTNPDQPGDNPDDSNNDNPGDNNSGDDTPGDNGSGDDNSDQGQGNQGSQGDQDPSTEHPGSSDEGQGNQDGQDGQGDQGNQGASALPGATDTDQPGNSGSSNSDLPIMLPTTGGDSIFSKIPQPVLYSLIIGFIVASIVYYRTDQTSVSRKQTH